MDLATISEIGAGAGGMGGTVLVLLAIAKKYGLISIQKPNGNGNGKPQGDIFSREECHTAHKQIGIDIQALRDRSDDNRNRHEKVEVQITEIYKSINSIDKNVGVLLDRSRQRRAEDFS